MNLQEMQARAREWLIKWFYSTDLELDSSDLDAFHDKSIVSKNAEEINELIARVRTETLEELQGWIGERKTAHGRAHGSIDCTQCAYDDIAAHLRALREGNK